MLLAPRSAAVVVVAGLPGAGKTTLVAERRALDSDAGPPPSHGSLSR